MMSTEGPAEAEKRALRAAFRTLRRNLDPSLTRSASADAIALARADTRIAGARTLAGYVATDGELDIFPLLADAARRGAAAALPRSEPDGGLALVVVPSPERNRLPATGRAGIPEPTGEALAAHRAERPAVLLAPAVALDRRGHRLGRGGGAYDRLLAVLRPAGWWIVGVCPAVALLDRLPAEPHDQPVDAILTEEGLLPAIRG